MTKLTSCILLGSELLCIWQGLQLELIANERNIFKVQQVMLPVIVIQAQELYHLNISWKSGSSLRLRTGDLGPFLPP